MKKITKLEAYRQGMLNPTDPTQMPSPEELLAEALAEPPRRVLQMYSDTIEVLKDHRNMTFREIADWLAEKGIQCDHNAVYREYSRIKGGDASGES